MKPSADTRAGYPPSAPPAEQAASHQHSACIPGEASSPKNSHLISEQAASRKHLHLPTEKAGPQKNPPLPLGGEGPGERGSPSTRHPTQNPTSQSRWLAIHTKPRQEDSARQHLERQGFEVLLPQVRERRRRGTRMEWRTTPMFPRYLFVRADINTQSIAPIRSTRGCVGPVRIGGHPAFVPAAVIAAMQARCADTPAIDPCDRWQAHQALEFTEGPFAGLTALFEARDGEARAHVLLEMLGRWQRINVPLAVLQEAH